MLLARNVKIPIIFVLRRRSIESNIKRQPERPCTRTQKCFLGIKCKVNLGTIQMLNPVMYVQGR